jgi:hypothetical protein
MKKNEYMVLMKFLWKLTKMNSNNSEPLKELINFVNVNMEELVDDNEQLLSPNGSGEEGFTNNTSPANK